MSGSSHLSEKMGSSDGEGLRLVDKFNGENFSLWKFKMEMVLAA